MCNDLANEVHNHCWQSHFVTQIRVVHLQSGIKQYLAANTALPHPPNTSQKVPKNSANNFLCMLHILKNQRKYSSRKHFSTI